MSSLKVKFSAGRCLELHGKKLDKWTLQQLINHPTAQSSVFEGWETVKKGPTFQKTV